LSKNEVSKLDVDRLLVMDLANNSSNEKTKRNITHIKRMAIFF